MSSDYLLKKRIPSSNIMVVFIVFHSCLIFFTLLWFSIQLLKARMNGLYKESNSIVENALEGFKAPCRLKYHLIVTLCLVVKCGCSLTRF